MKFSPYVSKSVYSKVASDHKIKASQILEHKDARAQVFKSCYEAGLTMLEIATQFDTTPPTVYRNMKRAYPKEFRGRA